MTTPPRSSNATGAFILFFLLMVAGAWLAVIHVVAPAAFGPVLFFTALYGLKNALDL